MQSSSSSPVHPGPGRRPAVDIEEALRLGADLGWERIRRMDEHGIDMQIVSWTSPIQLVPDDKAIALCRSANDRLSKAVTAHPDRLQGMAALPWQQPAAAVDELDRAVTDLGLRGVLILGRPGAGFLDDAVTTTTSGKGSADSGCRWSQRPSPDALPPPPHGGSQVNLSVMASVCPDQLNLRCQHPALGRLTDEGPGPPAISRTTDVVVPSSTASIVNGRIGCCGSRETQRILFETSGSGEATGG
nr:amidohydrolase family protein [Microbispora sp. NBRC 16548]